MATDPVEPQLDPPGDAYQAFKHTILEPEPTTRLEVRVGNDGDDEPIVAWLDIEVPRSAAHRAFRAAFLEATGPGPIIQITTPYTIEESPRRRWWRR